MTQILNSIQIIPHQWATLFDILHNWAKRKPKGYSSSRMLLTQVFKGTLLYGYSQRDEYSQGNT
ncbi:hypothetical protein [Iningainema tapete]|uniref:Transposase n=1 Tax=Iningainema tapete BLCC-T55 TaxID=2748662 RepID=A0A8J6XSJ3_9CYAN|nr:hypothetical protein [Iningainema tapete]MBD2775792.1 hypothetical protein [Iningainema tapete BLCC-T55]